MNPGWLRYVAFAGWLAIAVLSLVPGQERPHTGFSGISEHFAAYALVAGCYFLAVTDRKQRLYFAGFVIAASAIFEICQLYVPGRRGEILGVLSAAAGVGFAALAASIARSHIKRRN
jgi:VanZ family protein